MIWNGLTRSYYTQIGPRTLLNVSTKTRGDIQYRGRAWVQNGKRGRKRKGRTRTTRRQTFPRRTGFDDSFPRWLTTAWLTAAGTHWIARIECWTRSKFNSWQPGAGWAIVIVVKEERGEIYQFFTDWHRSDQIWKIVPSSFRDLSPRHPFSNFGLTRLIDHLTLRVTEKWKTEEHAKGENAPWADHENLRFNICADDL